MGDGYVVDLEQIRAHARNVEAIRARFDAVKTASAHIAQDDQAYGLLCGWIAAVLEGRHTRQDELIAQVEENLALVVEELGATADEYTEVEESNARSITAAGSGTGDG
ncbi:excreted virulence factor EspC (type VII ESX diderm) [Saccharothrix variisporea]|uniref:Excreted virulence factor EspC (Type VII ESX diderm) n=2 Tax=Saccharothrix variisporea TaxID=543527 RepID=A0A495XJW9_9PSEU|nr:type VII secretion target [Saccharothrix variisporea]RKT74720.1 excreted virulence factor EspC (type VII ESX diderm) [Saccharothrix variisporea]